MLRPFRATLSRLTVPKVSLPHRQFLAGLRLPMEVCHDVTDRIPIPSSIAPNAWIETVAEPISDSVPCRCTGSFRALPVRFRAGSSL